MSLTIKQVQENPLSIAAPVRLPSGTPAIFRPLDAGDAQILGQYFINLSAETRRRFGPHPFDQATADHLCATINLADTIRMIAVEGEDTHKQVIAYFILVLGIGEHEQQRYAQNQILLDAQTDCTAAPSVADAFQNQGVGSPLMSHLIQTARILGRKRMVLMGGTQATNLRGIHFYQKHGFRTICSFEHPVGFNNYDMMLDL